MAQTVVDGLAPAEGAPLRPTVGGSNDALPSPSPPPTAATTAAVAGAPSSGPAPSVPASAGLGAAGTPGASKAVDTNSGCSDGAAEPPPLPILDATDPADSARAYEHVVRLCRSAQPLSEEEEEALLGLAEVHATVFVRADSQGICPVHWLCASPHVSALALDTLLEALPAAAARADHRGFLPLHWLAANDAVSPELTLLVLEAHEGAAAAADRYGQLPLHWLCSSAYARGALRTRGIPLRPTPLIPPAAVLGVGAHP